MKKTIKAALVDKINLMALYSQSTLKEQGSAKHRSEVTNSQIIFLKYLKMLGLLNMKELAQCINTTPSFSSRLTTQLEDNGFVRRVHKPDMRKEVFVELTNKGEKELEKIEAADFERRGIIVELIYEGFGDEGLKFAGEVLDFMIGKYKEFMEAPNSSVSL